MAGLLDFDDPRSAFLTQLASGLLAGGGYSTTPKTFGQIAGAAMPGAVQAGQAAQQNLNEKRKREAEAMAAFQKDTDFRKYVMTLPQQERELAMAMGPKYMEEANKMHFAPAGSQAFRGFSRSGDQIPFKQGGADGAGGTGRSVVGVDAQGNYVFLDPYSRTIHGTNVGAGQYSTDLQGNISASKERGKEVGSAVGQAQVGIEKSRDSAQMMLDYIDGLVGNEEKGLPPHPGFQSAVGATMYPGARFVPGSDTRSFINRLEQIQGGSFLEAFQMLKGGGQITEVEGKKATQAINRMETAASEQEFLAAANDLRTIIKKGLGRAERMASGEAVGAAPRNDQKSVITNDGWSAKAR